MVDIISVSRLSKNTKLQKYGDKDIILKNLSYRVNYLKIKNSWRTNIHSFLI